MGRDNGLTETQLRELPNYTESKAFSPLEREVLDYVVALTETPARATDAQVARLRESLSEEQLVELTGMIAWENFRARFNRGFDVQDQGFSQGAYCVLPERHAALPQNGSGS